MNPNQMIALTVAAVSALMYYTSMNQAEDGTIEVDPAKPKKPKPKKLSAFTEQVNAILSACPYATPRLKIEHLVSGKQPEDIVKLEMMRLGEGKNNLDDVVPVEAGVI